MSVKPRLFMMKTALAVVLGLLLTGGLWAQQTISGTVTSAGSGEPLTGATVLIKGTTQGAFTDQEGNYSVQANSDDVLVVSYIGYLRIEVPVEGRSSVDIELEPSEKTLDEVVVTGYGTQKAKEVTSAISSVKAEDFNRGNVNDPVQLVQGKVAGVTISKAGSDPNGGFNIRLRGLSTLGSNTQPLIIIDGVIGASLQTVDPNDIQSIDVLKDGSAAAIYGTRASSGVIIVTTKKGIPGESKVNYNGYVTAETVGRTVPTMSADEFVNQAGGQDLGNNTNWIDQVTKTGVSTVHNLSLTGGTTSTTYRASLNYRAVNGVALNSGFDQLNGRLNLQQKAFGDRLTLTANLSLTDREAEFGFTEALRYANIYNPTAPVLADEEERPIIAGRYGGYFQQELFDYFNPLAIAEQGVNVGNINRLLVSGKADLEIVEGLVLSAFYSQQREKDLYGTAYEKDAYFRGFNRNGLARRATDARFNQQFDLTANFNRDFGALNFDLLAGYTLQDFLNEGHGAEGGDFLSDAVGFDNLGAANDFNNGLGNVYSYKNSQRLIAFFGRAKFNVDDTYFLEATLRREGSSRFGQNNKWGLFPAVSGAVNLGNLINVSAINSLKVRAGYGVTGATPNNSYLSFLRFAPGGNFFFQGEFVPSFSPSANANPNLKWETKRETNVGIDFALLDFKLSGSLDVYTRTTRDLIFNVPVPVPPNQAARTWANLEDVALVNNGVEATLGYQFGDGRFTYEPRLVFTAFTTVLDTLDIEGEPEFAFFDESGQFFDFGTSPGAPGQNNDPMIVVRAGERIGQFYGFQVDEDQPITSDGGYNFIDVDEDGAAGPADSDGGDEIPFGQGLPDFTLGINNSLRLGNVDINFFLRGVFGHQLANMYRNFYESLGGRPSDNKVVTEYFDENLTATPVFSSYYVEDASYVTLDNMTIGYTIPTGNAKYLSSARFYLTGQNLFFLTNYTGVDPSERLFDTGASDNGGFAGRFDPLAPGIERRNTYFTTRQFTLGVNLTF